MTNHPVKVGTKVRCKNKNWPDEPGVVERIEGDQRFAAVRYGQMAHTLSTYVEDLEPVT